MARIAPLLLIAVLAGGCDGQAPSPSAAPSITDPSSPSETPTPTASDVAGVPGFDLALRLEDVDLTAVAEFDGGFVVGGCVLLPPGSPPDGAWCDRALILSSPDGRSWQEVELPGADGSAIIALADTPLGFLALGRTLAPEPPLHRVTWRSDDGETWEPFETDVPSTIVFEMAASLDGRTVLIGSDMAYDLAGQTEAWATVDGSMWASGTTPVSPKIAAHPGVVAVGDECVDLCPPDARLRVFRSADGLGWTEDQVPTAMSGIGVTDLAAHAGRAIVGGVTSEPGSSAVSVWLDEPAGWRGVVLGETLEYPTVTVIPVSGGLAVIAQVLPREGSLGWWSTDGRSWVPARFEGIEGGWVTASAGRDVVVVILDSTSIWVHGA